MSRGVVQSMVLVVAMVVVVTVEAGVVGMGMLMAMGLWVAAGQALMPTCMPTLLICQQHLGASFHLLALGQPRL